MKFEITQKGVYDESGKRVPVGTVVDLTDETIPTFLTGKGRDLSAALSAIEDEDEDEQADDEKNTNAKKTAVTNPKKSA